MYHSRVDEEVFFEDAMVSVGRLRQRDADITVTAFDHLDHVNTWVHAMPLAVKDFMSRID